MPIVCTTQYSPTVKETVLWTKTESPDNANTVSEWSPGVREESETVNGDEPETDMKWMTNE
jgi:hypothetical protein